MEMKKIINMVGVGIVVLILFMTYSNSASPAPRAAGNTVAEVSGVQNVKLRVEGGTYILEPSTLEAGKQVRLEVDMNSVQGCARSIVISEFGVSKYVKDGDNIITFMPNKEGTFAIRCSMNMYRGTFNIGKPSPTVFGAADPSAGGSCSGEGGCGCGGK